MDAKGGSGVVPYLPLKELSGSSAKQQSLPQSSSPPQASGNSSQTQPGDGQ